MSWKEWFQVERPMIDEMKLEIKELQSKLKDFEKDAKDNPRQDLHERVAELEVKMSKLWSLLVEKDMRGKDKLTRFGRLFGGRVS